MTDPLSCNGGHLINILAYGVDLLATDNGTGLEAETGKYVQRSQAYLFTQYRAHGCTPL